MTMLLNGVFRDGVFHPNEPVELADNTPVTMAVSPKNPTESENEENDADRERREIHEILVAAGMVRPSPVPGPVKYTISKERREELARKLAEIGHIYDIVREERDSN